MFKDILSKFFKIESLLSNATGYLETRVELLKVELREDLAKGLAKAVAYLMVAFTAAVFLIFVSIAIALLLGGRLGNVAGFSIVAAVYLIAAAILWFSREKLIAKFEARFGAMFSKKQ